MTKDETEEDYFDVGDKVKVGDIEGVVEEIIYARNCKGTLLLIEWWHDGDLRARRFHAIDVKHA